MSDSLRVDSAAVRAAASRAGSAAATATPASAQVRPCASDVVSGAASTRFGARMALARQYAAAANAVAAHYGVKLSASAEAYDRQEDASAAQLGGGGAGVGGAQDAADAVSGLSSLPGLASTLGAAPLSGAAPGEVPESPRDIARLIETGRGGVGKQTWQAAEASLHREARELDDAADQMGAAISAAHEGWQSSSADAATAKMRELQSWYRSHADYVRGLAGEAQAHVQNFTRLTASTPTYQDVLAAERELQNAVAMARRGGLHRAAVVHAQVKVSGHYQTLTTHFSGYSAAEALPSPQPPTPPPGLLPDSSDAGTTTTPGDGKVNTLKPPAPSTSSAPVDPVQAGNGVGQDLSPGATFPVGATDPAAAANPLVDALPDTAGSLMPQVIPGLIGGVVGGLGGALGGLAGAGQKAVQSMQQAAAPLMNELGQQHPESGEKPQEGGEQSSGSEPSPEPAGGDLSAPDGGGADGGGGGGEMEPAGGAEPMAAPPDVAPTPAAAAPAAAAAPPEPAPATGMMGPMMAPPMGASGGRGSGPDVKELYRDRKLKVVAPPNSEPVKNRREGRERKKEKET